MTCCVWLALMLLTLMGCAGQTTGKPLHAFPQRAELTHIAQSPDAKKPIEVDFAPVSEWQLQLPNADANAAGHALLARWAPEAAPSAALDCFAHEVARVALTSGKAPGSSLQRFFGRALRHARQCAGHAVLGI